MCNNFDKIRQEGRLLYEYVRGSTLYGLNTPQSDVDTSGVFICNPFQVLGLRLEYQPQVQDIDILPRLKYVGFLGANVVAL